MKGVTISKKFIVRTILALVSVALCAIVLTTYEDIQAYNSEEHKYIVDEAMAHVKIDPSIVFPTGTYFDYSFSGSVEQSKEAKEFAVGFQTNDVGDYSEDKKGVQDNSYWKGYLQREGNFNIWIADDDGNPDTTLRVRTRAGAWTPSYTMGQLAAFYGDYRRTVYCDMVGQDCWITNNDGVTDMNFSHGEDHFLGRGTGWRPEPIPSWMYLGYMMSGLWPPYATSTALQPTEENTSAFWEAAWWGDEMLRIANVNDWHFSNGAVAWYAGMHRLALEYVKQAIVNPNLWNVALHYEANALHALTDLFAFGHVVTSRGQTALGIMRANNLVEDSAYKWMKNVLTMGWGIRDSEGKISLHTELVDASRISDAFHERSDIMESYAGNWASYALSEKYYHEHFNETGATVRNLKGHTFYIYGDGDYREYSKLNDTDPRPIIMNAVIASVQSLFNAFVEMKNGEDMNDIGSKGSSYFEALKYIPVFIESTPENYFWGEYTSYAEAVDRITGTDILEINSVIKNVDGEFNKDSYTTYPGPDDLKFPSKKSAALDTFPDVTVDVEDKSPSLPSSISLSQNYPNPFNPSSTIEFSLTEPSEVTIMIYNSLSQMVRKLVDENYSAGTYKVHWDGNNQSGESVTSGVYFYIMKAGEFSASKKMTVLK